MKKRDFSRFAVYVDESGDHSKVNLNYPVFVLAFCLFEKECYANEVTSKLQQLKFKYFGHDAVVMHERELRKQRPPFEILRQESLRAEFMSDLDEFVAWAPFTIVASVIHKQRLAERFAEPEHVYHLAMKFGLERIHKFQCSESDTGTLHVLFEERGRKEDAELELEFRRIAAPQNISGVERGMEPVFVNKKANHCGLQLADLVARPIGLSVLYPNQPNRAYEILKTKLRRSPDGDVAGYGLKVFPP